MNAVTIHPFSQRIERSCRSAFGLGAPNARTHRRLDSRHIGTYALVALAVQIAGSVRGSADAWRVVLCGSKSTTLVFADHRLGEFADLAGVGGRSLWTALEPCR